MPELFNVLPPKQALELLRSHIDVQTLGTDLVPTQLCLGRFLAHDQFSDGDLPSFPRCSMDGYSLRAKDTFGATEGMPAYIEVMGDIPTGAEPGFDIAPGQAARAHTGGMLAPSADAVVMVEHTQTIDDRSIEIIRAVGVGENVIQPGEDISVGQMVLPGGHRLRPQDLGGLTAVGKATIEVARKPRVGIISTGDEVISPQDSPSPGQVRDVNSFTLAALVEKSGGVPSMLGIVGDNLKLLNTAAAQGLASHDVLVISAGSSVSARDMTADVIQDLGEPGVLLHGVALRPGKPTVIAVVDGKPVFGLPGNPVSAMIVFNLFVQPLLAWLSGCSDPLTPPTVRAILERDIPSAPGREDYLPVRLTTRQEIRRAEPVFGKSNLIYTLVRADGLVQVPLDKGGLYQGEEVEVHLW